MSDRLDRLTSSVESRPAVAEATLKAFLVAAALHQMDRVRGFIETQGLHPDSTFGGKPTALCYAVLKPHHCLMEYLLERGASIKHEDMMGMTPLHYAALGGCAYCLATLIGRGAELNRCNKSGATPLALTLHKPQLAASRDLLLRYGAAMEETAPAAPSFH